MAGRGIIKGYMETFADKYIHLIFTAVMLSWVCMYVET